MLRARLRLLAVLPALLLLLLAAPASAEPRFFDGIEDLPIMPGLTEDSAERFTFTAGRARVIERGAYGHVTREAVDAFYGATLEQLGWKRSAPLEFRREGEILRIEYPVPPARAPVRKRGLQIRFLLTAS
jgi:hypothetical protein